MLKQESRATVGSRIQMLDAIVDGARIKGNGQCPIALADLARKCAGVKVQGHEHEICPTIGQPVSLCIEITHGGTVRGMQAVNQPAHVFLEITIGNKYNLETLLAVAVQNS